MIKIASQRAEAQLIRCRTTEITIFTGNKVCCLTGNEVSRLTGNQGRCHIGNEVSHYKREWTWNAPGGIRKGPLQDEISRKSPESVRSGVRGCGGVVGYERVWGCGGMSRGSGRWRGVVGNTGRRFHSSPAGGPANSRVLWR